MNEQVEDLVTEGRTLDITGAEHVHVEIRNDGKVVWLHVDGVTIARVCRIESGNVTVTDHRVDDSDVEEPTDEQDDEPTCRASYNTGGLDPYGTDCDQPIGHYPKTPHEGPDPFGGEGRVRWTGGGMCAGDPLPYHDVEFTESRSASLARHPSRTGVVPQ